jgi:MFS family permease
VGKRSPGHLWLVLFIFSLVCVQGLTINLMPLMFGTIARTFDIDLRQQGQLQSAFSAGGALALLISGYVTEAIRPKRSGALALLLAGAGSLLLGLAPGYLFVLGAAAVIGLGTQWVLAVYSAIITAHFADIRQRMFTWTLAVFAASATLSPYLLGRLLAAVPEWRMIFVGYGLLLWAWIAGAFLLAGSRLDAIGKAVPAGGAPVDSDHRPGPLERLRGLPRFLTDGLFNRGALWLIGVVVILDQLAAGNIIAWTPRFFELRHHASPDQAGLLLSASAAGVCLGRLFLAAFVAGRLPDRVLLGITYAGAMLTYMLILVVPSYPVAVALMGLNGALLGAQAPTCYSLVSAKFGDRAATAIPLTDGIGTVGGLFSPPLIGAAGDRVGLGSVLWIIPVFGFGLTALVLAWELYERKQSRRSGAVTS